MVYVLASNLHLEIRLLLAIDFDLAVSRDIPPNSLCERNKR